MVDQTNMNNKREGEEQKRKMTVQGIKIEPFIPTNQTEDKRSYIIFIPFSLSRDHDAPGEVRKKLVLWAASAVGTREGPTLGQGVVEGGEDMWSVAKRSSKTVSCRPKVPY